MGYGNLAKARDLRPIVRLDDLREQSSVDPQVHAAVFTTHDLNLNFVLTELLPGLLVDPSAVPPGMGPGNRTARGPLLDLPPVAIVHAPEASVSCEVQWRPPAVDLCVHVGKRRQHSKVTAILFTADGKRWIRLIASSANLTRRAFVTNLEVAAFENYEVGPRMPLYPSLFELRRLLEAIAAGSDLGKSRACAAILDELPERKGKRTSETIHFVHSADRITYGKTVADWVASRPENGGEYQRALIASPFYSAKGESLHRYFRDDIEFRNDDDRPIDVIVDGRQRTDENAPYTTPPTWLGEYSSTESKAYRPAVVVRTRDDGELRGSNDAGRPLHAKMLALAYERARARIPRYVWRMLVGSSNFTESGFGLVEDASLEAGFLVEYEEDEPNQLLGLQPSWNALCVGCKIKYDEERAEPDPPQTIEETAHGKSALRCLAEGGCTIDRLENGDFQIRVDLSEAQRFPDVVSLGKNTPFAEQGRAKYELRTRTLVPYSLLLRFGDSSFQWPLPVMGLIEEVFMGEAGLRHRRDRLLEYWLRRPWQEPDDGPIEDDPRLEKDGRDDEVATRTLGSWQLNRLLLGVRRRLTESLRGAQPRLPAAEQLMATVRTRELVALATDQPVPDRLYFGTLLRATLLGYWAGEQKKAVEWADAKNNEEILSRWRRETAWQSFEEALDTAQRKVDREVLDEIDRAAESLYGSVRDREVAK